MALDPRETDAVAHLAEPVRGGLWRRARLMPAGELHVFRIYDDGGTRVWPHEPDAVPLRPGASIIRVSPHPFAARLSFRQVRTSDGFDADIAVDTRCRIVDPAQFLGELGSHVVQVGPVSRDDAAGAVQARHVAGVRQAVASLTYRELRAEAARPDAWPQLLGRPQAWHEWTIERLTVVSAAGDRALRAADADAATLRDMEAHRDRQRAEQQRAEIRTEAAVAAAARNAREIEAKARVEQAEFEAAFERLQRERRLADLTPPPAPVAEPPARMTTDPVPDPAPDPAVAALASAFMELFRAGAADGAPDPARMAAKLADLPPAAVSVLAAGGKAKVGTRDVLAAMARRRAAEEPGAIRVVRSEVRARDLAFHRVDGVRIGQPISFAIEAARDGFLTLILNGSSEKTMLLAPSAWLTIDNSFLWPEEEFTFPGPRLVHHREFEARQAGPEGWEEIVAILSEEPLIEPSVLAHALRDGGFAWLSETELRRIVVRLEAGEVAAWAAGTAGYEVRPEDSGGAA